MFSFVSEHLHNQLHLLFDERLVPIRSPAFCFPAIRRILRSVPLGILRVLLGLSLCESELHLLALDGFAVLLSLLRLLLLLLILFGLFRVRAVGLRVPRRAFRGQARGVRGVRLAAHLG